MRRTVGVAAGVAALVAMTGVAVAAEHPSARPRVATQSPAAVPAPAEALSAATDEIVGTVEPVTKALDYLGGQRSTTFRYPGASYLKVHFNRLLLLPGDYVTVANAAGTESHRYSGDALRDTADAIGQRAGQWAMSLDGDTAVITLHTRTADPAGLRGRLAELGVGVDRVARGFTAAEREARLAAQRRSKAAAARRLAATEGRQESICSQTSTARDAVCYRTADPVAYARSKAVARLLINGNELCTAWRIGPNNRMITNHHCFTDTYSARSTEVWFNYECGVCGGFDVLRPTKVMGDRVLATDSRLDFTLFTVQNFDSISRFGYLQLDVRAPRAGEELYIPQHPGGDPTQIAVNNRSNGNCVVTDPSADGYGTGTDLSYYCDTEGGSSGSPVLARGTNKVIGLHHFGGCPNAGVRIDLIYNRLSRLL
ncbi:trypsin-like serine peptidase [Planosporangium mesophilum]|uniref:Serine protease n=1 Tax=Planosporangium mesophilum TaxID=689768 RepID=A0A8J3TFQ4_9ACTN|nr:serine protease [Planosporangium mesophilum]NJC83740.1 trypsin-like peptidase domain-containing protein [Planosporangium mesophilum]GII26078.1 hypothetical protein Pme01_56750 [Planosporangium mesophilum]